ncbi:MAG: GtrA family protein [Paludibacteraceae bacterium]|nr:GtrA family protein [Paludibacteraceae bacterium]
MNTIRQIIIKSIDYLYQPFKRFLSPDFFRYGVCGASNMVLDWILYFVVYNFVVGHELIYITIFSYTICISPHIAALCIVFPITLLTGFLLNKYITFSYSSLHGTRQFIRYISIVGLNLAINYFGLHLFVDIFHWYPTPSKMFITLVTIAVSYFGQKYYSFRK